MKTIYTTLCLVLLTLTLTAQDKIYVHTATLENTSGQITFINHPDLNGNPSANVVFSQHWDGVFNDNPTGLYYDVPTNSWTIFNENSAAMPAGAKFNIYIADDSQVYTHIATAANTSGNITNLDIPGVNSGTYLFYSNYWNPNQVYNPLVYGNYFNGTVRALYVEDGVGIPMGAAFKVMVGSAVSALPATFTSGPGNIDGAAMMLDDPILNGNPNATFVYAHYWGIGGVPFQVSLPHNTGIFYNTTTNMWGIFNQDLTPFPENVAIDVIIANQDVLSTPEFNSVEITLYPNPVQDILHINASSTLKSIEIHNLLGQLVFEKSLSNVTESIDVSTLVSGQYITKITSEEGVIYKNIIKK